MVAAQGAVMVADISGFTALTEDLGRQGAAGVELLTRCMNNFFTLVIQLVRPLSLHGSTHSVIVTNTTDHSAGGAFFC